MNTPRKRRSLDRFLSRCGVASRVEAARLIRSGRVQVNGNTVRAPQSWVHTIRDQITLDGKPVEPPRKRRVVVYYKKRGLLVTASDPGGRATVFEHLPARYREDAALRPVGRLDKASGGLLLLTNDTDLSTRLLDSAYGIPKTYRVKLAPAPSERGMGHMRSGMRIGDRRPTAPCGVTMERRNEKSAVLRMVLAEGRNRQIRRMAEKIDCQVEWLVRIRFGPVDLGELTPGEARDATPDEVEALLACVDLD